MYTRTVAVIQNLLTVAPGVLESVAEYAHQLE